MIETITIALWSHLFCGPWSESGKVFGWLKSIASNTLPDWALQPLIGCAMCHAVWISGAAHVWHVAHGCKFGWGNALQILLASFLAWLLDDFAQIRDAWKNR